MGFVFLKKEKCAGNPNYYPTENNQYSAKNNTTTTIITIKTSLK